MTLKIYLLGQFRLQADDQSVELPSRPAQSLLAYLVLGETLGIGQMVGGALILVAVWMLRPTGGAGSRRASTEP